MERPIEVGGTGDDLMEKFNDLYMNSDDSGEQTKLQIII